LDRRQPRGKTRTFSGTLLVALCSVDALIGKRKISSKEADRYEISFSRNGSPVI
jgi:hypothetical protein